MKTSGKSRKFRMLLLAGVISWLIVVVIAAFMLSPMWLPSAVSYFAKNYVDRIEFEIESFSHRHAHINALNLETDQLTLKIPSMDLDYTPKSLWNRNLQSVHINQPHLHLSLESSPESDSKEPFSSETLEDLLKISLPPIPLRSLTIDKFQNTVELPNGIQITTDSALTASFDQNNTNIIAHNSIAGGNLELRLKDSTDLRGIELNLELSDPSALFDKLLSGASQLSFRESSIDPLDLGSIYGSLDWNNQSNAISLQALAERIEWENQISAETLFLKSATPDYLSSLSGVLSVEKLKVSDILETELNLSFELSGMLSGKINTAAEFQFLTPALRTQTNRFQLSDVEGSLKSDLNSIDVLISTLSQPDIPISLHNISSNIHFDPEHLSSNFSAYLKVNSEEIQVNPKGKDSISLKGQFSAPTTSIEAADVNAKLVIPSSNFQFLQAKNELSASGLLKGNINAKGTLSLFNTITDFRIEEFEASVGEDLKFEGSFSTQSTTDVTVDLPDETNPQANVRIPQNDLKSRINLKGNWQNFGFAVDELVVQHEGAFEIDPLDIQVDLAAQKLKWDIWKALDLQSKVAIKKDSVASQTTAYVLNKTIKASANYSFDIANQSQEGTVKAKTAESSARSEINLKSLFPEIPTTILSGILELLFQVSGSATLPQMSLAASLREGKLILPDSGVSISGINLPSLQFSDLVSGKGPKNQVLLIDHIEIPPAEIKNVEIIFTPNENYGIQIEKFRFEFCQGVFDVKFIRPIEAPYNAFDLEIRFRNLELKDLTQLIPDFKEDISGKIEGFLPLSYSDETISWKQGKAKLVNGTTATLKYSKNGIIAKYIPEITISQELNLDINSALRDLTITDLAFDIRSSEEFSEPTVVIMSGHTNDPRISIPVERIQLNIRAGDLPGLINRSFNASKWLKGVGLGK